MLVGSKQGLNVCARANKTLEKMKGRVRWKVFTGLIIRQESLTSKVCVGFGTTNGEGKGYERTGTRFPRPVWELLQLSLYQCNNRLSGRYRSNDNKSRGNV